MREAADRLRAMVDAGKCTGAAAILTDATQSIEVETNGTTRADDGVAITERTRFRWASCSKPVTAVATLLAVQEGLVGLDTPIRHYLPSFSVRSRPDGDAPAQITVRHLLSHMAGLTRQAPVDNSYDDWPRHVASISDTWLRFPVGLRYAYSDIGVDLVGRILEVVSGEPFARFVASRVFTPLGMDDATFDRAVIRADHSRAIGRIEGRLHGLSGVVPAGSMHASVRDLGRFLQFALSKGCVNTTRVLSSELLDEMATVPFPVPGQVEGYALGLRTRRTRVPVGRGRQLGHAGRGFGFLADMWWLPEEGIGAAAVVNSHDEDIRRRIVPALLDRAAPGPRDPVAADVTTEPPAGAGSAPHDAARLMHRAGRYAGALHQTIVFAVRDGVLGRVDGERFDALTFLDPTDAVTTDGARERYRFMPAGAGGRDPAAPRYVVRVRDGESWSYNDGPTDPPGPDRAEWDKCLGEYALVTRAGRTGRIPVANRNGYLYIASQRISEDRQFLFTPRGEHVDLDGDVIRVGSRTLQRLEPLA